MKTEGSSRKATDRGMHHELRRVSSWRFDQLREWSNQGMSLTPKQTQRRNKILGELVASETSYIRSLHQIYDEYLDPLFDQDMIGENFYLLLELLTVSLIFTNFSCNLLVKVRMIYLRSWTGFVMTLLYTVFCKAIR
eukprot:UN27074